MAYICDEMDTQGDKRVVATIMKKLLFIDLEAHRTTGSSAFFFELLRQRFDVDRLYVNGRNDGRLPSSRDVVSYDCVICWQVNPGNARAKSWRKPAVYVPMYDGETFNTVKWLRTRLQGGRAISFSRHEGSYLKRAGLKTLDVKWFPVECDFGPGDNRKAFLWERGGITEDDVRLIFFEGVVDEVVVRRGAPEPGDGSRQDYLDRMSRCGIFVAPRFREGIGLSFLEAMAMGKCVIANKDGTMDEYIEDYKNGVLVDFGAKTEAKIDLTADKIRMIQRNAFETCRKGREIWKSESELAILDFVDAAIADYRPMSCLSRIAWWLLLPLHFLWDVKTLVFKICG